MQLADLDVHLARTNFSISHTTIGADTFTILVGVPDADGNKYEVAFKRTGGTPWVPDAAIHVRPHRVTMGQAASQVSPLGADWQYLSRQFNRPPTAKSYVAHLLTVVVSPI